MPGFKKVLRALGESCDPKKGDIAELEHSLCCVYGFPRFKKLDSLRLHLLKKKCENNGKLDHSKNIDFASFPPCGSTLKQHVERANFQVKIWKDAGENFPELADPTSHCWVIGDVGLEPMWSDKPVLPTELVDMIEEKEDNDSEDEEMQYMSDISDESDIN